MQILSCSYCILVKNSVNALPPLKLRVTKRTTTKSFERSFLVPSSSLYFLLTDSIARGRSTLEENDCDSLVLSEARTQIITRNIFVVQRDKTVVAIQNQLEVDNYVDIPSKENYAVPFLVVALLRDGKLPQN